MGDSFFPKRVEDLPAIYEQISDELSSQYTLGYTSSNPLRNGQSSGDGSSCVLTGTR